MQNPIVLFEQLFNKKGLDFAIGKQIDIVQWIAMWTIIKYIDEEN
jgi:hypothetical protein